MIMIVISFALVKFYAFAILYVLIVMQIKLVVVVVIISTIIVINSFCYTTKAARGPITKINESDRSIAGPIFS